MRILAVLLIGVTLCGCGLSKQSVPEPRKEQIRLHGIVDFDESTIRPDSQAVIEEAAAKLKKSGNLGVVVEGHSDSTGSLEYNEKLSIRRAEAVRDQLVALDIAKERIVVIGQGASQPIASNDTPEGRAQNRRVVITVYQP